jgi:hypothetical protein
VGKIPLLSVLTFAFSSLNINLPPDRYTNFYAKKNIPREKMFLEKQ